jgi:4-hydroxybutyrate CoA-transferase
MGWRSEYEQRLTNAQEAVRAVRSGQRVVVPIGCNPLALCDALAARVGDLKAVEIVHCAVQAQYGWLGPGFEESFRVVHEHWASPLVWPQMKERLHDYVPIPFSRRFKALDEARSSGEQRAPDIMMVVVSPPDDDGYVNLGSNVWNTKRYIETVPVVLAEVSPEIPRCHGDTRLHVSEFASFVESHSPPMRSARREPNEVQRTIAGHVGEIIRDGDTLQIGAGSTSNAIAWSGVLREKRDLGWHSEASPSVIIDLVREGVITGARKTANRGKAVATGFGVNPSQRDYIDGNPLFELYAADYVHDPRTIACHDNFVAINNALSVDLSGQITSESVDGTTMSGTGGQLEFSIGAAWSKGGRSLAVLPSTATVRTSPDDRDGRVVSRLVPNFPEGTAVTVPRLLADIVVTEFGVARLWGKSTRERARELIGVAHPDFRAGLRAAVDL